MLFEAIAVYQLVHPACGIVGPSLLKKQEKKEVKESGAKELSKQIDKGKKMRNPNKSPASDFIKLPMRKNTPLGETVNMPVLYVTPTELRLLDKLNDNPRKLRSHKTVNTLRYIKKSQAMRQFIYESA